MGAHADPGPPTSYLALEPGARVVTRDGHELGTVAHVLALPEEDIFDGLVVDTARGHRFVDAPEVATLHEREVRLTLDAAAAANLPEPTASPAVVDAEPDDAEGSELGRKLRRAWDLISGRY